MRALRHDDSGTRLVPDHPEPAIAPGEALIRPLLAAVASPDLAVARGLVPFTGTLGHEFIGVVERALPASTAEHHQRAAKAIEGRRVVGAINLVCGQCALCRSGLSSHCQSRRVLGLHAHDGCLADRFTLPIANLVEVPKGVRDEEGVFAQSIAAALHAAQMVRIEGKTYITVLGDGPVALFAAQALARRNASVRLLGKHPAKFALCERWGIKHRHVAEAGRRQDQDVVIDCTGSPTGLDTAVHLVRPRGKIVMKSCLSPSPPGGGPERGWPTNPTPPTASKPSSTTPATAAPTSTSPDTLALLVTNELELLGTRCGKIADAVGALAAREVDATGLISRRARLADAMYALAAASAPDAVRVLVEP